MSIIDEIKANTLKMSKKQRAIGAYMVHNQGNIPFMSLNELSKELEVSEVTILNFCKQIGLDSFTELKKAFQELIKEKLRIPVKMKTSLEELESTKDAYTNALHIQKMNFDRLVQNNDLEAFEKTSHIIAQARKIFLCGLGVSELISTYLHSRFRSIGIDTTVFDLEDFSLYGHDLVNAGPEDVFILIAFPDYSIETVRLHEYLLKKGKRFVSITNCESSPIAQGAEAVLMAENKSLVFYNFLSNTFTLLEILLIVLSYTIKDDLMENLNKIFDAQDFFESHCLQK